MAPMPLVKKRYLTLGIERLNWSERRLKSRSAPFPRPSCWPIVRPRATARISSGEGQGSAEPAIPGVEVRGGFMLVLKNEASKMIPSTVSLLSVPKHKLSLVIDIIL